MRFARALGNKVERGMLRLIVQQWRAVAHGAVVKRRRGGGFDARRVARLLARVLLAWRALVLRTHANWRKVRIYQRRRAARSLAALFKEWTAWSFYQRHQRRSVARYERGAVHALLRRSLTELSQGFAGELTMSDDMEALTMALHLGVVPAAWARLA